MTDAGMLVVLLFGAICLVSGVVIGRVGTIDPLAPRPWRDEALPTSKDVPLLLRLKARREGRRG